MTNTYRFIGVECRIGRGDAERVLHVGDTIELTDEESVNLREAGAALELIASPRARAPEE